MRNILSGAGFRFALLHTLAFMAAVAVIGLTTRYAVVTELEAQARQRAETEASALVDEFDHGGRPDLDAALAGRRRNSDVYHDYRVIEPQERGGQADPSADRWDRRGITVVRDLADSTRIVVSDDLARVRTVRRTVDHAFLFALGVAALLGLATGLLLSGSLLRRLDRVTRTADAVAAGDLSSRIAIAGSGDEFDRLARTLNRMLDRIVVLLSNLRQVSNDVAHDLRTPMSRLRQGLEVAHHPGATTEGYRQAVGQALAEIDGILDIFAALLRIAQIESGTRRAGFRAVDLSRVVAEVAEAYAAAAEETGRTLATRIAPEVAIRGDRELLVQMFANLVENALQHTPPGGRICLGLEREGDAAVLASVADDGPGIPITEHARIFQRFYRFDPSRSDAHHGLGLSLVAAIADLHEGTRSLSDNDPGLRIDIRFPG